MPQRLPPSSCVYCALAEPADLLTIYSDCSQTQWSVYGGVLVVVAIISSLSANLFQTVKVHWTLFFMCFLMFLCRWCFGRQLMLFMCCGNRSSLKRIYDGKDACHCQFTTDIQMIIEWIMCIQEKASSKRERSSCQFNKISLAHRGKFALHLSFMFMYNFKLKFFFFFCSGCFHLPVSQHV